ncbi:XrtA system polysaccharide chain length determinant [Photobacterium minamisatsumaniensis]|uniref:XrtA system polysaccharide chain length determinant n=1 Tax=Photobacterium minamisatsumaniensis TaxID=2910233 RepID=UPI003D0AB1AA
MKEQLDLLLHYLRGVWLYRRWAIITLWIICPIGWVAVTFLPNQYTSEARVYADTRSILQPLLRGLAIDNDPTQELRLMVKTLLSRRNLETIARYTDADVTVTTNDEYDELLEDLKDNIKIRSAGKENLFTISYSGKDPEYVQGVVQASLDVFVENAVGQKRQDTSKANEFIESQLNEYEARLLEAESKLAEFKRANAGFMPGAEKRYFQKLEGLKVALESTRLELKESQTQLKSAQGQLNKELSLISKQSSSYRTEYDLRLESLESRLDSLLFRFTEKHPDVIETRRQITELKKLQQSSLDQSSPSAAENPVLQEIKLYITQLENAIASLTVREASQVEKLSVLAEEMTQIPNVEAELTSMMRNYDVTRAQYEQLLARRESALISQSVGASSDEITFRVIDAPLLPKEPSGPMRPLFLIVVLFLATGAGVALAFLNSQIRPVVISANQLFTQTKLPVFGVVSATNTSGIKAIEQRKVWRFSILSVLLLVCFTCFMVINIVPSIQNAITQELS